VPPTEPQHFYSCQTLPLARYHQAGLVVGWRFEAQNAYDGGSDVGQSSSAVGDQLVSLGVLAVDYERHGAQRVRGFRRTNAVLLRVHDVGIAMVSGEDDHGVKLINNHPDQACQGVVEHFH
jgi:hypothetical protein